MDCPTCAKRDDLEESETAEMMIGTPEMAKTLGINFHPEGANWFWCERCKAAYLPKLQKHHPDDCPSHTRQYGTPLTKDGKCLLCGNADLQESDGFKAKYCPKCFKYEDGWFHSLTGKNCKDCDPDIPREEPELKRCPFCGGYADIKDDGYETQVYCKTCGVMYSDSDRDKAINLWNLRSNIGLEAKPKSKVHPILEEYEKTGYLPICLFTNILGALKDQYGDRDVEPEDTPILISMMDELSSYYIDMKKISKGENQNGRGDEIGDPEEETETD